MATRALLALAVVIASGCGDNLVQPVGTLPPRGSISITADDPGRVDIGDSRGTVYARAGRAEVLLAGPGGGQLSVSTDDGCDGAWTELTAPPTGVAYFSALRGYQWRCAAGGVELAWRVYADAAHDTAVLDLTLTNTGSSDVTALRMTPLITEQLFVGVDPTRHRILDDGADLFREAESYLHYPDEDRTNLVNLLPMAPRGNVIANWNHAIVDLDGARSWIAGALEVERAFPFMATVYDAGDSPEDRSTGRRGFNLFAAELSLAFAGKVVHPGDSLRSEAIYIDPLSADPFTGLEDYADAVAAWLEVTPWTRRGDGRRVPNGWNSWSGGGGTGGLGTDIDEALMAENLAVMAREFAPFGIDYFQIDDGYQRASGDWVADPTRFPAGMADFSRQISDAGLIPGYWIEAFIVARDSQLAADHPGWLTRPEDAFELQVGNDDKIALDLSNPEVQGWLRDTARRYRDDFDAGWLKLDFGYRAMPYVPRADPEVTSVEAYKAALRAVREGLGDDVFYLGIAMYGLNFGIADGMRLTLDSGPRWEKGSPLAAIGDGGSVKSTVVTGARRYYFHDRLWITHNDLLFFRTEPDAGATLTMTEAEAFASFMGLTGSIIKFGEDLRTLTPEQINTWRKLLPIYPATARPMDLFVRHYPERYRLPIDGTLAGSDARWLVVGLLNWGENFSYEAAGEPERIADEARSYRIDLRAWGLDPARDYLAQEFWSESFLGVVRGELVHTVEAHGRQVIALREATGAPQFLGHNRHFTQGATDLIDERWDARARTLTVRLAVAAGAAGAVPFEYRVKVYAPAGYAARPTQEPGVSLTQDGEVVTYAFTPAAPGERDVVIQF